MSSPIVLAAGLGGLSFLALHALPCLHASGEPQESEPTPERRWCILVTNDDGIGTRALAELVAALAEEFEVVVCAPDGNRSGSSQSLPVLSAPMRVSEQEFRGARRAVAVSGSPADAVAYGLTELAGERPFDLVVSGINQGPNVGDLAHASGTVGAAMQAVYQGVPAIAVSQGMPQTGFASTAAFTARFVRELERRGPRPGVVYSINVPSGDFARLKGVAVRPMGGDLYVIRGWKHLEGEDGSHQVRAELSVGREAPAGSDMDAFLEGWVTITPMRFDWTDHQAIREIESWGLSLD